MRQLLFKPLVTLSSLFGTLFAGRRLSLLLHSLKEQCYAAYIRHCFVGAKGLMTTGYPIRVIGGKHITLGQNVTLGYGTRLEAIYQWENCQQRFSPQIILGDNVVLAPMCRIGCVNKVSIGSWTTTGQHVYITDHTHGGVTREELSLPPRHRPLVSKGEVKIGSCVHIGENCCIMPGVSIGDHSVIGAGAVVTRDIPPYSVAEGNPARVIKTVTADV